MSEVPKRIAGADGLALGLRGMAEREREANLAAALRQRGPREGWHNIGDPGEPTFSTLWQNDPAGSPPPAGFYKGPDGFVHLRGSVRESGDGGGNTIFTLPEGYRPHFDGVSANFTFPTIAINSLSGAREPLEIHVVGPAGGSVSVSGGALGAGAFWLVVHLNGIHFYAGP